METGLANLLMIQHNRLVVGSRVRSRIISTERLERKQNQQKHNDCPSSNYCYHLKRMANQVERINPIVEWNENETEREGRNYPFCRDAGKILKTGYEKDNRHYEQIF
jgi:hypothetical protein